MVRHLAFLFFFLFGANNNNNIEERGGNGVVSFFAHALTPITDLTFIDAIDNCLAESPVDGECTTYGSSSGYGTMPNWDVSQITKINMFCRIRFRIKGGEIRKRLTQICRVGTSRACKTCTEHLLGAMHSTKI